MTIYRIKRTFLSCGFVALSVVGGSASAQSTELPGGSAAGQATLPPAMQVGELEPADITLPQPQTAPDLTHHVPATGSWRERCRHFWRVHVFGDFEEYRTPPLGMSLYTINRAQVANGEAAYMVLNHIDFEPGKSALTPYGMDRLARIVALAPRNFAPIVVARVLDNPALAQARRDAVIKELKRFAFPIPPERVVVGAPSARGLTGVEAEIINYNHMQLIQNGPTYSPIGFGGGFTTGGTSTGSSTGSSNSGGASGTP